MAPNPKAFTRILLLLLAHGLLALGLPAFAQEAAHPRTFCNPLDIEYRFQLDPPSRREAADPVIVLYQGDYFLFASKSGGYWHSNNLRDWTFIAIKEPTLPIEDYAPAALVMDGALVLQFNQQIFKSTDPKAGQWQKVADIPTGIADPALFLDDDHKLYMTMGCGPNGPLYLAELDKNFKLKGPMVETIKADQAKHGWELGGTTEFPFKSFPDTNALSGGGPCYVEGSWLNKHNGLYYMQYAAPGTQWQIYGDGYFTASSLKGPWTYAPNNPFSYKPTGFIGGAGHSATFDDKDGRPWHISTMVIADKHWFERRLGLFPAAYDKDNLLYANTYLGDYPQMNPGLKKHPAADNLAGWWLVSYGKSAEASSTLDAAHDPSKAFDENVRSAWSAKTGDKGEWLKVDLEKVCRVNAIQVNFAEQDAQGFGRKENYYHQYTLEASSDGHQWSMLVDKSQNQKDVPHDYVELAKPAKARHLRLTNLHFPAQAKFSVRDLRVFGNGLGKAPARVSDFKVERDPADERQVTISWPPAARAEGTIVRYGIAPDKLYENYQTRGAGPVKLVCLNAGVDYYFTLDSFNDSALTRGKKNVAAPAKATSEKK